MITTNKEINLAQLDKELGSFGLIADFNDVNNKIIGIADNSPISLSELQNAVNNHIAQAEPELTIADKLASIGLSLDELKSAILGGN